MTRFCTKVRFATIALVAIVLLCTCGGCDDPADLLAQATGYTAAVSQGMALRGWSGFPANPLSLADYMRDLAASVKDARNGVVTEGLGDGAEPPMDPARFRDERQKDIRDKWWR